MARIRYGWLAPGGGKTGSTSPDFATGRRLDGSTLFREHLPGNRAGVTLQSLSGDKLPYHFAVDIGQTPLDSVVVEREFFVVDTEKVQGCGVQVVTVGWFVLSL